ncbi:MAG: hypothetical protein CVV51_01325, partial [Spirochaetae bacterium HGW-Spirochaetae-7]
MNRVLSIVLGGGKGSRLFPLTKDRAKPAVPFGGRYRIVDIPISNCINSGFKQIYILTQFNSASLHLHIAKTYVFDNFSDGFAEVLAAEQTLTHSGWYEGTADAVRKNLVHFRPQNPTHYVIVSGDQLYRMDLADMFQKHLESGKSLTIACTTVNREDASSFGIVKIDSNSKIVEFQEKPGPVKDISDYKIPAELRKERRGSKDYLASMGIYIFDAALMEQSLDNDANDFGKEIIPMILGEQEINAYIFDGYWEDIGTIKSFYEANLDLTAIAPTLIESELFGHVKGAFTGAIEDRAGLFETCPPHGTVFLDELGELETSLQVKLLRVLQNRTFQRVGESGPRRFDGKIVAATNRDMALEMGARRFREDLYYRLCADVIVTPSLREQLAGAPEQLHNLVLFTARRVAGGVEA